MGIKWNLTGSYDQSATTATLDQVSIFNDFFNVAAKGTLNTALSKSEANIDIAADDLAKISSALGIDQGLAGNAHLTIDASMDGENDPLITNVEAVTENFSTDSLIAQDIIGLSPKLTARLTQSSDGSIKLEDLNLNASLLSVTASADLSEQKEIEKGIFRVELSQLDKIRNLQGTKLNGKIEINGEVSGNVNNPSLAVETGFDALDLQGFKLNNFDTKLNLNDVANGLNGSITASGDSNFGDLNANISFLENDDTDIATDINITLGAFKSTGNLNYSASQPITGEIILLTDENEVISDDIKGVLNADISLSNENGNQKVDVDGTISDFILKFGDNQQLGVKSADISANALLQKHDPDITLNANILELMHPAIQVAQSTFKINQIDDGLGYQVTATGTEAMPYSIDLTGNSVSGNDGAQNIILLLNGFVGETPIAFNHKDMIRVAAGTVVLPPFGLELGEGQIDGTANIDGDNLTATINAHNADLAPMRILLPDIPATGLLNGSIEVAKTIDNLNGNIDLSLSNIVFSEKTNIEKNGTELKLAGLITQHQTNITGTITSPTYFDAEYEANIPLKIDTETYETNLDEQDTISGSLSWNGQVSPLWPALKLPDHDLSGDLKATFNIGGSIADPDINGSIGFSNGHYENMQTGFVAGDIDLNATILERVFTLDQFTANDGENGAIDATANIHFAKDLSFDAEVNLMLANAKLLRQPELEVMASTDLTFIKNASETSLKGDITVDNADIGAIEQSGPTITTLDVVEINADGAIIAEQENKSDVGVVDLDLNLNVPGKLFIRSFGLDSEWEADLAITGNSDKPIISGTASQIRGFFEFSGKRFELTRGSFSFPGDSTNDPIIEIAAEHQLQDMIAYLRVFGPASNPKLEMSSNPYLPENEVMARILFGTSVAQLTAVEAVQLASAVHSLSNGGGQGLMGGVRRAIGVDRLSIDNDASREYGTTITGGKYLTDNVYVEVSTAPATGQTATSVEIGLTRNLSLVTRRTLDHDNNLSIRWFWDY